METELKAREAQPADREEAREPAEELPQDEAPRDSTVRWRGRSPELLLRLSPEENLQMSKAAGNEAARTMTPEGVREHVARSSS